MLILLVALTLMLAMPAALGEDLPLLAEDGLRVSLMECQIVPGEACLVLQCVNDNPETAGIDLLMPESDGAPAGFRYGWGTEQFSLNAGETREVKITLEDDDPKALPSRVAFRFLYAGRVSSPGEIEAGRVIRTASFTEGAEEPPLVDPEITLPEKQEDLSHSLSDTITRREAALLDYGQAVVCLRLPDSDALMPLCVVPVSAAEDGAVTGRYSGLYLTLAENADFIVPLVQQADISAFRASAVTLSGDAVLFAQLAFTIADGRITRAEALTEELEGQCLNPPFALFDIARAYCPYRRLVSRDYGHDLEELPGHSAQHAITAPLRFALRPAADLGELCVYYEYYFTDNSSSIHVGENLDY